MLRFLFPGLTEKEPRGASLFRRVVSDARDPSWFKTIGVPDTLDGRFSVLASITALTIVRLERGGEAAWQASVALTERFVESMDHEHRQLGYGDPTLGKLVRKLTGSLARRVERFRAAVNDESGWEAAAEASLHGLAGAQGEAKEQAVARLMDVWQRLERASDQRIVIGEWE
jgi:cytochrome b pre-mRNA-processing protein 3